MHIGNKNPVYADLFLFLCIDGAYPRVGIHEDTVTKMAAAATNKLSNKKEDINGCPRSLISLKAIIKGENRIYPCLDNQEGEKENSQCAQNEYKNFDNLNKNDYEVMHVVLVSPKNTEWGKCK